MSEDGEAIQVWSVATRQMISERQVRNDTLDSGRRDDRGPGGRGGNGQRRGGPFALFADRFSATDESLAIVAPDGQGVFVFDSVTGERLNLLKLKSPRIAGAVLVPPYGQRLVTIEQSRGDGLTPSQPESVSVNLWDPTKLEKPIATLVHWDQDPKVPNNRFVPLVSVSPDGKTVVISRSRDTSVTLWSIESGQALGELSVQTELTAVALGPDNQLATAGGGEVRLWDIESKVGLASLAVNQSFVRLLQFSPRGRLLAIVGGIGGFGDAGGREVELWDTASHALVAVLPTPSRLEDIAFSPDGQTLAASSQTGGVSSWAVVEPDVRLRLAGFDEQTRSMAFRPDGLLALGSLKGTIRFWSGGRSLGAGAESGSRAKTAAETLHAPEPSKDEPLPREQPASLAFDDRGRLVTLEAGALRVWDAPPRCAHSTIVAIPEPKGMIAPNGSMPGALMILAPSTDCRTMVLARGPFVWLWHPASSDPPVLITPPLPPARTQQIPRGPRGGGGPGGGGGRPGGPNGGPSWRSLALNSSGDRLFLVSMFGETQAWALDASEGGIKATRLAWEDLPASGSSLAIRPDGQVLAVGDRTGAVSLIDTSTGKVRAKLRDPMGPPIVMFPRSPSPPTVRNWPSVPSKAPSISGHSRIRLRQ